MVWDMFLRHNGAGYMCLLLQGFSRAFVWSKLHWSAFVFSGCGAENLYTMNNITIRHRSRDYHYEDERLRFVLRASDLNISAFAREIGLPDCEIIYKIKYGKAHLTEDIVRLIHARYPQIDGWWLLTGNIGGTAYETAESQCRL